MTAFVVGDYRDVHVEAVVAQLGRDVLVVDAETVASQRYTLFADSFHLHEESDAETTFELKTARRGWIRRLAPADWMSGVVSESRVAATKAARLSLLAAIVRNSATDWLSSIDSISRAENKLTVYALAVELDISTPQTLVSNSTARVFELLGDDVVVKPLGPGHLGVRNG